MSVMQESAKKLDAIAQIAFDVLADQDVEEAKEEDNS